MLGFLWKHDRTIRQRGTIYFVCLWRWFFVVHQVLNVSAKAAFRDNVTTMMTYHTKGFARRWESRIKQEISCKITFDKEATVLADGACNHIEFLPHCRSVN